MKKFVLDCFLLWHATGNGAKAILHTNICYVSSKPKLSERPASKTQ